LHAIAEVIFFLLNSLILFTLTSGVYTAEKSEIGF